MPRSILRSCSVAALLFLPGLPIPPPATSLPGGRGPSDNSRADKGPSVAAVPAPRLIAQPTASDQIWNEGASTPVASNSIIQGGLSAGTSNGGGVIDADPELTAAFGDDGAAGTLDDDLAPVAQSVGIDAGSSIHLPADRFDLDGDGDLAEPLPVDRAGNLRIYDGGAGAAIPDIGAYEYGSTGATGIEDPILPAKATLMAPYPNPARESVTFEFRSASRGPVRLVIFDALGREVATAFDDLSTPGRSRIVEVPTSDLASGVYVARLVTASGSVTRQFVVER